MKIFLNTAEIDEIRTVARGGILDRIATNPTAFSKVGGSYDDVLERICATTSGPVSADVVDAGGEGMSDEGRDFAALGILRFRTDWTAVQSGRRGSPAAVPNAA